MSVVESLILCRRNLKKLTFVVVMGGGSGKLDQQIRIDELKRQLAADGRGSAFEQYMWRCGSQDLGDACGTKNDQQPLPHNLYFDINPGTYLVLEVES